MQGTVATLMHVYLRQEGGAMRKKTNNAVISLLARGDELKYTTHKQKNRQ